jgi:hypothetical protein
MNNKLIFILYASLTWGSISCQPKSVQKSGSTQIVENQVNADTNIVVPEKVDPILKSEEEWAKSLPEMAHYVLREKGTERSFTGKFWDHHEEFMFVQLVSCHCLIPIQSLTLEQVGQVFINPLGLILLQKIGIKPMVWLG